MTNHPFNFNRADKQLMKELGDKYSLNNDEVLRWVLLDRLNGQARIECRTCADTCEQRLSKLGDIQKEQALEFSKLSKDKPVPEPVLAKAGRTFRYIKHECQDIDDDINKHFKELYDTENQYKKFLKAHNIPTKPLDKGPEQ